MPNPLSYTLFTLIISVQLCSAQVVNDQIENRLKLSLNRTLQSETANCTVEWLCLDESLTGKEVEYHNDQWFYFNTNFHDKYFINISNQRCRDQIGVQLVVINGQHCHPETYKIVSCISLATQDDIFVELKDLKIDHSYLVNIDGYLNDFCSFDITVSDKPAELPVNVDPITEAIFTSDAEAITIQWQIPEGDDIGIHSYQIFRKGTGENKHHLIDELEHERDVYGHFKTDYTYVDTLSISGLYHYIIVSASLDGNKTLVRQLSANYSRVNRTNNIKLILTSNVKTSFKISVYDEESGKFLLSDLVDLNDNLKALNYFKVVYYDMQEYREFGFHRFRVVTVDQKTKKKEELFY
jgi:hypothetical protein